MSEDNKIMPAHRKGTELAKVYSIRLGPAVKDELVKRHGSLQGAIDNLIEIDEQRISALAIEHAGSKADPESPEWEAAYQSFVMGYLASKK